MRILRLPTAVPGLGRKPQALSSFTCLPLTVKPERHASGTMDLTVETIGNKTFLIGDTYQAKDIIKRHGGRWDGFRQGWAFNDPISAQACADEVEPHLAMMKELEALDAM